MGKVNAGAFLFQDEFNDEVEVTRGRRGIPKPKLYQDRAPRYLDVLGEIVANGVSRSASVVVVDVIEGELDTDFPHKTLERLKSIKLDKLMIEDDFLEWVEHAAIELVRGAEDEGFRVVGAPIQLRKSRIPLDDEVVIGVSTKFAKAAK